MTIEEDRAELERIAVSWQGVPELEQEAMLTKLGTMLEYLDPNEDAEYQLRTDAARLIRTIEARLGR
jgi:hypothetical protein